jgi:AraC-like DNA-binding protein
MRENYMFKINTINSITAFHNLIGLNSPKHPLISVIRTNTHVRLLDSNHGTNVFGFYLLSLTGGRCDEILYGRNCYDFQPGTVIASKPGQTITGRLKQDQDTESKGWVLLFHPDLIRKSPLAQQIASYSFFAYENYEALRLSDAEKSGLTDIVNEIDRESTQDIDRYTQKLIINKIELLLTYCLRYYDRQFCVRTNLNQDLVIRFENLLKDYFDSEFARDNGLPSVKECGNKMNMSPTYLSDLLKKETGRTAHQHIHDAVVDRAKTLLLGTRQPISQIAYNLGFEYPQHFSKMFKRHTQFSPGEYRKLKPTNTEKIEQDL